MVVVPVTVLKVYCDVQRYEGGDGGAEKRDSLVMAT